jgi:outer membrane lipoprotein-sorting protein
MRNWIITFVLLLGINLIVFADPAEDKGLEIITELDRRDQGWKDSSADMLMTLRNKNGKESIR